MPRGSHLLVLPMSLVGAATVKKTFISFGMRKACRRRGSPSAHMSARAESGIGSIRIPVEWLDSKA